VRYRAAKRLPLAVPELGDHERDGAGDGRNGGFDVLAQIQAFDEAAVLRAQEDEIVAALLDLFQQAGQHGIAFAAPLHSRRSGRRTRSLNCWRSVTRIRSCTCSPTSSMAGSSGLGRCGSAM